MSVHEELVEGPITVKFKTFLMPSGEVAICEISKDGDVISLTEKQAQSLGSELLRRYPQE